MGLAASQARFLQLTINKSDLEFRGQQLNQSRTILANQMDELSSDIAALYDDPNFDPDTSVAYSQLQDELEASHNEDKIYEISLKDVDTQQKAVQTEIDSVSKVIDKNIDMTYKTFA